MLCGSSLLASWSSQTAVPPGLNLIARTNRAPTANAGTDQQLHLAGSRTVTAALDGSASTDDGETQALSYTWILNGESVATGVTASIPLALGSHSITLAVFDGELTASDVVQITVVDPTPPVISAEAAGSVGSNDWYRSDVSVSWTVTDAESDFSANGCEASSVVADTRGQTFTCSATSSGGSSVEHLSIKRDATDPTIAWGGNAGSYTVDQRVMITCSAIDVMSGLATSTCPQVNEEAFALALGSNTLHARARDHAGNTAEAVTTFTIMTTHGSLANLVRRWVTRHGVATSLTHKLDAAANAAARGQREAEVNILRAFRNEVEAQSGKSVVPENANTLIRLANVLAN